MDRKSDEGLTRIPDENDLVRLARELNRLGVAYVVIGGFAINPANQALVKKALEILPDKAVRKLADDDLAHWVVVRVNDDITVDLMTEACGVNYEEARGGIEIVELAGVRIPFASAELMLRMKQGARDKDSADRSFLQQLIKNRVKGN